MRTSATLIFFAIIHSSKNIIMDGYHYYTI
nr:MAG TPA: hypothetical protein [Caudoviricetes sp.]